MNQHPPELRCVECNQCLDSNRTICSVCQFPVHFYERTEVYLLLLDLTLCKSRVYRYVLLYYYKTQHFFRLMLQLFLLYFCMDLLIMVKERQPDEEWLYQQGQKRVSFLEKWRLTNQQFHPPSPAVSQFLKETLLRLVVTFLNEFLTLYLLVHIGYTFKVRKYGYDYKTIMLGVAMTFYIKVSYILFLAWDYNSLFKNISVLFQKMQTIQMIRALFEKDKFSYPILLLLLQLLLLHGLEQLETRLNPFPFAVVSL